MSSYKFGNKTKNLQILTKLKIAVSYNNKDKIKNLNCKWDSIEKEWYISYHDLTPEILNNLYQLQKLKTIGIIKNIHPRNKDIKQNLTDNNIPYFDMGYQYTSIIETYTIEELNTIYKNEKLTQVNDILYSA